MSRLWLPLAFLVILGTYLGFFDRIWASRAQARLDTPAGYTFPSRLTGILAVGNKGILADYLFLKTSTFFGERELNERTLSEEDWRFIARSLDTVTDLDPRFLDPYVFAQGVLAWEKSTTKDAIRLLEKGFAENPDNWRLPFYIGFDYYYLLGDYAKGAEYIARASQNPDSYSFLPELASRLYYYGQQSKTAILFLKDTLLVTGDPGLREKLSKRISALEIAAQLEELLARYREEQGQAANSLEDLEHAGYLKSIPLDPYGGKWGILASGRVYSTSRFVTVGAGKPGGGTTK